jgi:hypothetical protein
MSTVLFDVSVSQSLGGRSTKPHEKHEMKICFALFRVNSWIGLAYCLDILTWCNEISPALHWGAKAHFANTNAAKETRRDNPKGRHAA